MNAWIESAKTELACWDDTERLADYLIDVLYDLESAHNCMYVPPWTGELSEAAQEISKRLIELGAPYEVYHPW